MLTTKQQIVVDLVTEGQTVGIISKKLKTSPRVVKAYITKLTKKGVLGGQFAAKPVIAQEDLPNVGCRPVQNISIDSEEVTRMALGATVQFMRFVGGAEQAHRLIDEIRRSVAKIRH
jgi:hypothetical protein